MDPVLNGPKSCTSTHPGLTQSVTDLALPHQYSIQNAFLNIQDHITVTRVTHTHRMLQHHLWECMALGGH